MGFCRQFKYLLWKNFLIRKRQKIWAVVEIVWPLVLFLIIVWVRTKDFRDKLHECHYFPKAMPSTGFLPYVQSYICTLKNTCFRSASTDGDVGVVYRENSALNFMAKNVHYLLNNDSTTVEMQRLFKDVQALIDLSEKLQRYQSVEGDITLKQMISDEEEFINAAIDQNMSEAVARNWMQSKMRPEFFITAAKIFVAHKVTGFGDENLWKALDEFQTVAFCNMTGFNALMISADPTLSEQTAQAVCRLNMRTFVYTSMGAFYDIPKAKRQLSIVLANITGMKMNVDQAMALAQIVQRLQHDLSNNTNLGRLVRPLFTATIEDDPKDTNGTTNVTQLNRFRRLLCGEFPEDDKELLFRARSNLERMRDRFQGNEVRKQRDNDSRSRFVNQVEDSDVNSVISGMFQSQNFTRIICQRFYLNVFTEYKCWNFIRSFDIPPSIMAQFFTVLRGFFLISPKAPPVEHVVKQVYKWMDSITFLRDILLDFDLNAQNYQDNLHKSRMRRAIEIYTNMIYFASNYSSIITLSDTMIDRLDALSLLFANSTDSNATLISFRRSLHNLSKLLECIRIKRFIIVENETELEELSMCLTDYYQFYGAIAFNNTKPTDRTFPPLTQYKIRLVSFLSDSTNRILDKVWHPRPRDRPFIDMKYVYYGFSFFQDLVDRSIVEMQTNMTPSTGVFAQQFPNPCYNIDGFIRGLARLLPLCMNLAWVFSAALIVKNIVHEKELRLKEFMKVMGLGSIVHWIAWFLQTFVILVISIALFVITVKYGKILVNSDITVMMVFLLIYAIAAITQCFMISTFFNRANLAAACGGFIYFIFFLPYPISLPFLDLMTFFQKIPLCLLAQVSFGYGCAYLSMWEEEGTGLQWSTVWHSPDMIDNFNCGTCMIMLIVDAVLYFIIALYIEAAFPGEYGIPKPWYFFLQRSYWCGTGDYDATRVADYIDQSNQDIHSTHIEPIHAGSQAGVRIRNLRKVYSNGKVAVDGLSLDFYENQITSFLGHNGAGKTTTISILTGLYPPTSGTAFINGKDVRTQIDAIRQSLGMCPQHNILYDNLSVQEQLQFYAGLKGVPENEIQDEIDKMIRTLNLSHKRHTQSKHLSGGMQRKLSIAVAFVGNSKTVVLDEPTAGVDPYSRRQIWDLLLEQKLGRTIVLSTHHMDEADLLGDRIAIIAAGKLKCCGSSLFLKRLYGSSYYLTVAFQLSRSVSTLSLTSPKQPGTFITVRKAKSLPNLLIAAAAAAKTPSKTSSTSGSKNPSSKSTTENSSARQRATSLSHESETTLKSTNETSLNNSKTPQQQQEKPDVANYIKKLLPESNLVQRIHNEATFCLPRDEPRVLCRLFRSLEEPATLKKYGVSSYGVSETKLEEIFLKVDPHGDEIDKRIKPKPNIFTQLYKVISKCLGRRERKSPTTANGIEMPESSDEDDWRSDRPLMKPSHAFTKLDDTDKWGLRRRQVYALFLKRFINFTRNKKGAFCEILLPVAVIALTLFGLSFQPSAFMNQPPLRIGPWLYGPPNYVFYTTNNSQTGMNALSKKTINNIVEPPGLSYRCMPNNPFSDIPCLPVRTDQRYHGASSYRDVKINTSACTCSTNDTYTCPVWAYHPDPPYIAADTTDDVVNLTMLNVTDWILMTSRKYNKIRFGGLSTGEVNTNFNETLIWPKINLNTETLISLLDNFSLNMSIDWSANRNCTPYDIDWPNNSNTSLERQNFSQSIRDMLTGLENRDNVKIWYNNHGWAALPSYVNVLSNALLRTLLPSSLDKTSYGIITFNHPMNFSRMQQSQRLAFGYNMAVELTTAVMIILAFSVIPASFVLFLIEERVCQAKHLQFVSGVDPTVYWVTNFLWDMTNFLVPVTCVMLVFVIFEQTSFIGWADHVIGTFLLLYIYGFATIPIMYCFAFCFSVPSLAFICLAIGNLFFGWITTTVTVMLEVLGQDDEDMLMYSDLISKIFIFLPQYCLGRGLLDMKFTYFLYLGEKYAYGEAVPLSPFLWKFLGRSFLIMIIEGVLAFIVVLYIEHFRARSPGRKSIHNFKRSSEDDDVVKEREFVDSESSHGCAIRVTNLTKDYPIGNACSCKHFRAVDNICFTVQPGECFGLLGVNGAGKTTTFNMLTGKTRMGSGDAYFGGFSVRGDIDRVRKQIGFCPQFDALNLLLTAREQLQFYARIRGIIEKDVPKVVNSLISRLGLNVHADRISANYSGGNKRKLSTAIALIGDPPVVLFDEPTTGMDPKARRFLWDKINEIKRDGRAVVLTSHSMEECEVLCSRIGIMVGGRFKCLGSVQHLKSKYGSGYTLVLKLSGMKPKTDELDAVIRNQFPGVELKERHSAQLQYRFPTKGTPLSKILQFIITNHDQYNIEDYSLSQTTLDEVFISFVKQKSDH